MIVIGLNQTNKPPKHNYNYPDVKSMLKIAKKYMNFSKWKDEFEITIEKDEDEVERKGR